MGSEFILARHGESVVNVTRAVSNDVSDSGPLTEPCRRQARALLNEFLQKYGTTSGGYLHAAFSGQKKQQ